MVQIVVLFLYCNVDRIYIVSTLYLHRIDILSSLYLHLISIYIVLTWYQHDIFFIVSTYGSAYGSDCRLIFILYLH
jgi:hypothetical protein